MVLNINLFMERVSSDSFACALRMKHDWAYEVRRVFDASTC